MKNILGSRNRFFMNLAIEQAMGAAKAGEIPVGAVIIRRDNGEIVAKSGNMMQSMNDATAHAEFLACRMAMKHLKQKFLTNCDLYVTLEPCVMCSAILAKVRIGRIFYGVEDRKQGGIKNTACYFSQKYAMHYPDIYSGIMEQESKELIKLFFKQIRQD